MTTITSIAIGGSNIWVGTDGEGLIHFDKTTRLCTRIMQQDGMLMNNIGCLHLSGNTLWIGYGHGLYMLNGERMGSAGGLGRLDLATGKFTSFTPSLAQDPTSANGPPRVSVIGIVESPTGDIWFVPDDGHCGLHRHTKQSDKWEVVFGGSCDCLAANATTLFTAHGRGWNFMLDKKEGPLGVNFFGFNDGQLRSLKQVPEFLPDAVSTVTAYGDKLWVGGIGYVALIDVQQNRVVKFSYITSDSVDHIEVGGGYLWTRINGYLHRTPLPGGE